MISWQVGNCCKIERWKKAEISAHWLGLETQNGFREESTMPGCCGGCLFLLYCYYCATALIWMTVAWALSNNRKKVNFCNEEMEVVAPKITDPYSFLCDEGAMKCIGKLWCRKTVTPPSYSTEPRNSNKCTKMCINQIHALNSGFIPVSNCEIWAQQFYEERKRQRAKN